jgi:type I restriction enzyme S subunit
MNNQTAQLLEQHFDTAFAAPGGIKKLRELILTLAMQGRLVAQDPNDPSARELLKEIEVEKRRLRKEGKIKVSKPLAEVNAAEKPYALPEGWEWANLQELFALVTDGDHQAPPTAEYGVPFLVIGNLNTGKILLDGCRHVPHDYFKSLDWRRKPTKNDILYTVTGSYGIPIPVNQDVNFCVQRHVAIFKSVKSSPVQYLTHLLKSKYAYDYSASIATGIAQKTVPLTGLRKMPVPVPSKNEQHRIVAKIDQLMARCDELEKLRAKREKKRLAIHTAALRQLLAAQEQDSSANAWQFLTRHFSELYSVKENVAELRKAILQLAVMGKLVPQDPNDPPGRELLKEIEAEKKQLVKNKQLKIGQTTEDSKFINVDVTIPATWIWVKGIDIFFITKLAGFEYTKHFVLEDEGEIPVIRAQNVRPFKIETTNLKYIDRKTSELLERCALTKPALLVTFIGAGIGDVALFDRNERWHLAPNVAKMESFPGCEDKIELRYLNYFLISPLGRREIFKHLKSTAQPSISMGTIRDIDYPLPPLPEQHRIVAKIDQLMTLCDNLDQQINAVTGKQTELLDAVMAAI